VSFFYSHYGELFALLAAMMWGGASIFFTLSSREIGAGNLNRLRLVFAVVILSGIISATVGWGWTSEITRQEYALLALSGIIGLALGDRFYFSALKEMGPRLSTQVFALNPVTSTLFAWLFLGETLGFWPLLGIAVAVSGVIVVTSERRKTEDGPHSSVRGVTFALIATACHSGAFVLAKHVMSYKIDSLTGSFIRMVAAMIAVWALAAVNGKLFSTWQSMSTLRRWKLVLAGSVMGPSIGVWVALIGITHAPVGIASTLMALTPLFVIPLVVVTQGEKVSRRAILGSLIAFGGVALIFVT
jgi:drug/metabolite transporter (DMT)-like permease